MTVWLIDKSALARLALSSEAAEWSLRIQRGLVRISTITRLEVGFSARSASDIQQSITSLPLSAMPVEYLTPAIEDCAVAVKLALARIGQHRATSIPDLLIAATAELTRLTVLHVDKDFELIAEFTDQPIEWLILSEHP